jgi:hypothetical protein
MLTSVPEALAEGVADRVAEHRADDDHDEDGPEVQFTACGEDPGSEDGGFARDREAEKGARFAHGDGEEHDVEPEQRRHGDSSFRGGRAGSDGPEGSSFSGPCSWQPRSLRSSSPLLAKPQSYRPAPRDRSRRRMPGPSPSRGAGPT